MKIYKIKKEMHIKLSLLLLSLFLFNTVIGKNSIRDSTYWVVKFKVNESELSKSEKNYIDSLINVKREEIKKFGAHDYTIYLVSIVCKDENEKYALSINRCLNIRKYIKKKFKISENSIHFRHRDDYVAECNALDYGVRITIGVR